MLSSPQLLFLVMFALVACSSPSYNQKSNVDSAQAVAEENTTAFADEMNQKRLTNPDYLRNTRY